MSQTPLGDEQSVLLSQGSLMHVPTAPFVVVQYLPVAQFVTPPSVARQPVVHRPLLAVPASVVAVVAQ